MFTPEQKRTIAEVVQAVLKATNCPELPAGEVQFILHVDGAQGWSWANIRNNGAEGHEDFVAGKLMVLRQNLWLR